jgi:hypothetical protein
VNAALITLLAAGGCTHININREKVMRERFLLIQFDAPILGINELPGQKIKYTHIAPDRDSGAEK